MAFYESDEKLSKLSNYLKFIANETDAKHVYAFDLWVSATENYKRITANGLVDKIIPIHGDAMDMPFAEDYFDSIVSVQEIYSTKE
ncbi:methyltransferase domain-containing protein [Pseudobutyrivibrio sp.]|uniref:methyltransferase domain-containing protein n=1 Tax=Pseudobutyrivibrio sp. TaxID=2014367 RepID=UPI0025F9CA70|nr:methyltransferase domain-containing protein [Pseudobutyrivibrio sp.]